MWLRLCLSVVWQDGGNLFGERKFMGKVGVPMKYYFVAQSGGRDNSRVQASVSAVPGVLARQTSHEFSGAFDMSALLRKDASGNFELPLGDLTGKKRALDASTPVNDKIIAVSLQAHTNTGGYGATFQSDRVAQVLAYKPNIPA